MVTGKSRVVQEHELCNLWLMSPSPSSSASSFLDGDGCPLLRRLRGSGRRAGGGAAPAGRPSASRFLLRPHPLGARSQACTHEMQAPTAMRLCRPHRKRCVCLAPSEHLVKGSAIPSVTFGLISRLDMKSESRP